MSGRAALLGRISLLISNCVYFELSRIVSIMTPGSLLLTYEWGNTLISMNSTLNCLIFFWGNREMRKETSKILKKCFHRQQHQHQQAELNVVQMRERQTKR